MDLLKGKQIMVRTFIPGKSEQWKAPVKEWIHDMYDKRQEKSRKKAERKIKSKNNIFKQSGTFACEGA